MGLDSHIVRSAYLVMVLGREDFHTTADSGGSSPLLDSGPPETAGSTAPEVRCIMYLCMREVLVLNYSNNKLQIYFARSGMSFFSFYKTKKNTGNDVFLK